jgi:hypothetical protein
MNLHGDFRSDRDANLGQIGEHHHAGTQSVTQITHKFMSNDA